MSDATPIMISVTELQDFMRCRRQWDLISPMRHGLSKKGRPAIALHTGSAVHHGTAAPVFGEEPIESLTKWFETEHLRIGREYVERVGAPMDAQERTILEESRVLALGMVGHYFERYGPNPIAPFTYIAAELSFRLPVEGLDGVYLVGTVDGLAKDANGGLWLIEKKTYGQKPSLRDLQDDHQLKGYCFALQVLLNVRLQGVLYDGLMKKLPKAPRVLQSGMLSREWIDTTAKRCLQEIVKHHGEDWRDDEKLVEYYDDFLRRLRERDEGDITPFFTRYRIPFSQAQLRQWGQTTRLILEDMVNDPRIYPNRRWEGCYDCWMTDLCGAMDRELDVEAMIANDYHVSGYRPQYKAMVKVTPETVGSLEDLERLMERTSRVEPESSPE